MLQHIRRVHPRKLLSRHDAIARTLAQEILTGVHTPGAKLSPEAELTARFGVSRTVLREVMKTLSAKGLVVVKRRVGTQVLDSSCWNYFDAELLSWRTALGVDSELRQSLAEIRQAVEPTVAGLAAQRRSNGDIVRLRDCVWRMSESRGDREKFVKANLEFHVAISTASGNPIMRSLAAVIEVALFAAFHQNILTEGADLDETTRAHSAILDAIHDQDALAASAAMLRAINIDQARFGRRGLARARTAKPG
jgi:DNA-binding FadR family transcriptional regulator